jgi:AhpD family alkylhydroperoxidase
MNSMTRFESLTPETAAPAARPLLAAAQANFGFLPSPLAKAAHSPALLKHMIAGFGAFDHSSLSPLEREVVALTVAYEIECHYCMAMHSALLARGPAPDEALISALRGGAELADARLEALRAFVRAIVRQHGRPSSDNWQAMDRAGFSAEQVLDAVLGTGVYLMSTLTNVVTDTQVDPAFEAFRWSKR